MKKLTAAQIQNILFTAIVAIAAVLMYVLVGANQRAETEAAATSAPSPTPTATATATPTATPTDKPALVPVLEYIFTRRVQTDTHFRAGKADEAHTFTLICGDEYTGTFRLAYDVNAEGRVVAFTLRFLRIKEPEKSAKTGVQAFDAEVYETKLARQNEAIQETLSALLIAADRNGVLTEAVRLNWYTGVLRARDNGKYYSDQYLNGEFLAYPTTFGSDACIVCSLNIQ